MRKIGFLLCMLAICVYECASGDLPVDDGRMSIDESVLSETEEASPYISDVKPEEYLIREDVWNVLFRKRFYHREESSFGNTARRDYCYGRINVRRKGPASVVESGAVALRKSFEPAVTVDNTERYFLKKYFVSAEGGLPGRFIAGNYKLSFAQGLVFYDALEEYTRPLRKPAKGAKPDMGSNDQNYLKGFVWDKAIKDLGVYVFFSEKELSGTVSDNRVDEDLYALRSSYNELITKREMAEYRSFSERLSGCRVYMDKKMFKAGLTAYHAGYSKTIDPAKTQSYYSHVYRGDRLDVAGADAEYIFDNFSLAGEAAFSRSRGAVETREGSAWSVSPIYKLNNIKLFAVVYGYSPYYYNRHAQGPSFDGDPPNNEQGLIAGSEYKDKRNRLFLNIKRARSDASEWKLSGASTSPEEPAVDKSCYGEYVLKVSRELELYYRCLLVSEEKYMDVDDSDLNDYRQIGQNKEKHRYQVTLKRRKTQLRMRYDENSVKVGEKSLKERRNIIWGELKRDVSGFCDISFRTIFFGKGDILMNVYEPYWGSVYGSNILGYSAGTRFYLTTRFRLKNGLLFWAKYGRTEYEEGKKIINDCRFQLDYVL